MKIIYMIGFGVFILGFSAASAVLLLYSFIAAVLDFKGSILTLPTVILAKGIGFLIDASGVVTDC